MGIQPGRFQLWGADTKMWLLLPWFQTAHQTVLRGFLNLFEELPLLAKFTIKAYFLIGSWIFFSRLFNTYSISDNIKYSVGRNKTFFQADHPMAYPFFACKYVCNSKP